MGGMDSHEWGQLFAEAALVFSLPVVLVVFGLCLARCVRWLALAGAVFGCGVWMAVVAAPSDPRLVLLAPILTGVGAAMLPWAVPKRDHPSRRVDFPT